MKKTILLFGALVAVASAQSVFSGGNITQGGVLVGTYSFNNTGTTGYGAITTNLLATRGVEFDFAQGGTTSPTALENDVSIVNFNISAVAGYQLDSLIFGQTPFAGNATNGSNSTTISGNTTTYSVSGLSVSLADVVQTGTNTEIGTATLNAGAVEWTSTNILNANDDWLTTINLGGVASATGTYSEASTTNLAREWMTMDASFSQVPEPTSAALLGLGGLALLGRRKRA